jgi:hypothetical protein
MANGASRRRERDGICRSKHKWSMDEPNAPDFEMSVM